MKNEQQLKILEKDLKDFKEQYNKNGVEIAKNNQLIKEHIRYSKERIGKEEERWDKVRPMLENYKTIVNGSKIIRGVAYFLFAVGVIVTFFVKYLK